MIKIYERIINSLEAREDLVLMTIIASSGSTPRGIGARMLVSKNSQYGTIGGGAIEYRATQMAKELLETKKSIYHNFVLNRSDVEDLGMVCGGDVTVYFEYLDSKQQNYLDYTKLLYQELLKNQDLWLIYDITNKSVNAYGLYSKSLGLKGNIDENVLDFIKPRTMQALVNGKLYYIEKISSSGMVYVFGAGHIAQELVILLKKANFRVALVEDRLDFLEKDIFKDLDQLIHLEDMSNVTDHINFSDYDYAAIMTRGHKHDYLIQKSLLKTNLKYIGVMGSKQKVLSLKEKFLSDGINEKELERFNTPIGINIKGETPFEIAVSIAAELILKRTELLEN